jgi:hypothetical protein
MSGVQEGIYGPGTTGILLDELPREGIPASPEDHPPDRGRAVSPLIRFLDRCYSRWFWHRVKKRWESPYYVSVVAQSREEMHAQLVTLARQFESPSVTTTSAVFSAPPAGGDGG